MKTFAQTLFFVFALFWFARAADDYITGRYEHLDKVNVEIDGWSGRVWGKGKYVAGFVETFYDNLSENYRNNPELRRKVLAQMAEAERTGVKDFEFHKDEHWVAFQETIGWQEHEKP